MLSLFDNILMFKRDRFVGNLSQALLEKDWPPFRFKSQQKSEEPRNNNILQVRQNTSVKSFSFPIL